MKTDSEKPIIGVGVGNGLNAQAAEAGGADFLTVYSTAIYRTQGLPSMLSFLPYDNCNQLTFDVLPGICNSSKVLPVFAGLGAHDPRVHLQRLLDQAFQLGASGIANEPFIGTYGSFIQNALDRERLGFEKEFEMLKLALSMKKSALGWAFSKEECQRLAAAGVDYVGIMPESRVDAPVSSLIDELEEKCQIIVRENPSVKILLHGKALETDAILQKALKSTSSDGYFTGSSVERLSVFQAVKEKIEFYKSIET